MVGTYNKILELDNNTFKFKATVQEDDVIDYKYIQRDFPGHSQLEIKLKPYKQYIELVPKNPDDLFSSKFKPLILTKENIDGILYFVFITEREYRITLQETVVIFKGVDFQFFEKHKYVNANTNNLETDNSNLPEDFAKYLANTNLKQHLDYAYNEAFLNPKFLTYGKIATVPASIRKFPGLKSITVDTVSANKTVRLDQQWLFDVKDYLYNLYDKDLVTRQYLRKGQIEIEVSDARVIDTSLVRNSIQIIDNILSYESTDNYVFAWGDPNNATNVYKKNNLDFTTIEKNEDFMFTSGSNNEYLTNTANTYLKRSIRPQFSNLIKVNANDSFFTEINCGDIIDLNNKRYRILQIQENNSINGYTFDIEIKEVEVNGIII